MLSTAVTDIHITLVTFFLKIKCEQSKQVKGFFRINESPQTPMIFSVVLSFFCNTEEPEVIHF